MKTIKLLATSFIAMLAFGLNSCTSSKYDYQTVENDPLNAKIYTLPNGLKVYMTVNKEQPRIQTYIAVRTGSKNDPAETTGLAHYLEHLMFKGTTHFGTQDYEAEKPLLDSITALYEIYRTKTDEAERKAIYHQIDSISGVAATYAIPNEYDKLMAMIGADGTNAYTSNDVTCYTEDIPSNQIENWAKIQSDRFMNPVFRLFHTELEAVYEEKNMSLVSDQRKEYEALDASLYPNHPYGKQTTLGTQEHLKNPSLINIRNYFDTWYVPNNVAICLSGDFDPDNMIDILTRYFGDWKPSAGVPKYEWPAEAPITSPVYQEVLGQETENLMMGWRFDGAGTRQGEMLTFIDVMMNNGKAGLFDLDINQSQKMQWAGSFIYDRNEHCTFIVMGVPNPGQTLEECRDLFLAEMAKLRNGDFDDQLIPSVVTDIKCNMQKSLEENYSRANHFVNCFINGQEWADRVGFISRFEQLTKQDIVDFANQYFKDDNFACVYKRQGVDPNIQRIEKPTITPIQANRDTVSEYVRAIKESVVAPIEPVFVNYDTDLEKLTLDHGQQLFYRKNETNQTFQLNFVYEMGHWADRVLPFMSEYTDYLGTSDLTPAELQQQLYSLGCNIEIQCTSRRFYITLSGLDENLEAAVVLLDKVLNDAQPDEAVYSAFVDQTLKNRTDRKLSQSSVFRALTTYANFGKEYIKAVTVSNEELRQMQGKELTDRLHALAGFQHRVLYYGPSSSAEVAKIINANHKTAETLSPVPANTLYSQLPTVDNQVFFAPYQANNSIMRKSFNSGMKYDKELNPTVDMYNEYFGGSMNGIVFQEMRETRGLAYSAWAQYYTPSVPSESYMMYAQITTQNDKLQEAYTHFGEIIEDMPQSELAFQNAKDALLARLRTQRVTRSAILWSYVDALDFGLTEDPNKALFTKVQSMSLQDIAQFQQKYLKGHPYSVMLVSDPAQVDLKFFETVGEVKKLTLEDIFGY